jgi:hypothetical protein
VLVAVTSDARLEERLRVWLGHLDEEADVLQERMVELTKCLQVGGGRLKGSELGLAWTESYCALYLRVQFTFYKK